MTLIDRSSPVPLYFQLKQILLDKIESSTWEYGDMIPSEQELQDTYGLSRTTVRQTLTELVVEGHLVRQRGRGTFVSKRKIAHDPAKRLGLSDYMRSQGMEPGWVLLDEEWVQPDETLMEMMKLQPGQEVYRLRRIRLANNEPIGYHTAYLPPDVVERINRDELTSGESLGYIRHLPEMEHSLAHRSIEAVAASEDEVEHLHVETGAPVLRIERLIVTADDKPLEFLRASYRGDRFKYQITL